MSLTRTKVTRAAGTAPARRTPENGSSSRPVARRRVTRSMGPMSARRARCLTRMHAPPLWRMLHSVFRRSGLPVHRRKRVKRNKLAMNEALPVTEAAAAKLAPDVAPAPAGRIGVLLVNLGTPDAADAPAVRRYLQEFLTDPRVIENQGVVWSLVLNGVILRIRPRRKARDYVKIWNREKNESPLKTITRAQAEKLTAALASEASGQRGNSIVRAL